MRRRRKKKGKNDPVENVSNGWGSEYNATPLYTRMYHGYKTNGFFETIKNGAPGTRADGFRTEIVFIFFSSILILLF
jgi:hypothetical protein